MTDASTDIRSLREGIGARYFSFTGRLNRQPYWLRNILLIAIAVVSVVGVSFGLAGVRSGLGSTGGALGTIVFVVATIAFTVATLSLTVRRLHDRDKSGWWVLIFYVLPNILGALGDSGDDIFTIILSLASLGISIWAFVEIGCLRGTDGPNRYGPDPLDPGGGDLAVFE